MTLEIINNVVVDTKTGECSSIQSHYIVGNVREDTTVFKPSKRSLKADGKQQGMYERWEQRARKNLDTLFTDFAVCKGNMPTPVVVQQVQAVPIVVETDKPARGRPATVFVNNLAPYMVFIYELKGQWFDDICYGAVNVKEVGRSNTGEFCCTFRNLNRALYLPVVTTKAIQDEFKVSERTARYVASAARTAIKGIEHYLYTHPSLWNQIKANGDVEVEFQKGIKLTNGSTDFHYTARQNELRTTNTFDSVLQYGLSVQAFRKAQLEVL